MSVKQENIKATKKNLTEGFGGTKKVPPRVVKADEDIILANNNLSNILYL